MRPAPHPALPALLDRLIPQDEFPSATQNGVLNFWNSILSDEQQHAHSAALDALDAEAQARFSQRFAALQVLEQDAILNELEAGRARAGWPCPPRAWLQQAANLAAEGFYADPSNGANPERASWGMVGFRRTIERPLVQENLLASPEHGEAGTSRSEALAAAPAPTDAPSSTPAGNVADAPGGAELNALEAAPTFDANQAQANAAQANAAQANAAQANAAQANAAQASQAQSAASTCSASKTPAAGAGGEEFFDAVIIGAGAGGGAAACTLSEAGLRVLVLERGRDLSFDEVGRDHLRSQRLSLYGHNAGPDQQHPRVFVSPHGVESTVLPWQGGYQNNAGCVGGGTRVYGAQAWRFMPQDFGMASRYGVPGASSLADWPLDYAELEPWYERAERDLGVCGDGAAMHGCHAPRRSEFPLPPLEPLRRTPLLKGAAEALGWATFPTPLAIASRDYGGRRACVRCTECVGFACPSGAKAGSHNTFLPRALEHGCRIITGAMAAQVDVDGRGQARGVTFFAPGSGASTWERRSVRARVVIVAAGAVESARLLLMSRSPHHPHGLGNGRDVVGRSLQGHYYTGALGVHADEVYENVGPGPSIATNRWSHSEEARAEGIIGGGMLADDFLKPPIDFWKGALPPHLKRWGAENKEWMKRNFTRTLHIMGPVQDIPNPDSRVQLDAQVRDAWALPVARLSGTAHPETLRSANFLRLRAEEWLRQAGCEPVWSFEPALYLSAGQHQAGTCRMGDDPGSSVCDRWGRVHGQESLWVLDGSLHPTNGGFNPFLSIMALALRGAAQIVRAM